METIYDYFQDFKETENHFFKIIRDKSSDSIMMLEIYKKEKLNQWEYIGVTFIEPESLNKQVDFSSFLNNTQLVQIHKTPTLYPNFTEIQMLLTDYLKEKMQENEKSNLLTQNAMNVNHHI